MPSISDDAATCPRGLRSPHGIRLSSDDAVGSRMDRQWALYNRAFSPPIVRLCALAQLPTSEMTLLLDQVRESRWISRHRGIFPDLPGDAPVMLLDGWAARTRKVPSGRRQVLSLSVPGDIIWPTNVETYPVVALTRVQVADAPEYGGTMLSEAYAAARDIDRSYLLAQVSRLAGLDAQKRFVDLVAELYLRLQSVNLATRTGFAMPLTQPVLGDVLAITAVHTNRVVRALREAGELVFARGAVSVCSGGELARQLGLTHGQRQPVD